MKGHLNLGFFLVCSIVWLFSTSLADSATLIPAGSVWRLLDNGSNQGTAWTAPTFSDATWRSGQAELGYGDSLDGRPERTQVGYGPSDTNKYITTYFRRTFLGTNVVGYTNLYARMLYDDGAVLYLNGVE